MKNQFLTEGDGYIDITLSKPASIDGAARSTLRMREPTVRDLEASQSGAGSDAAREIQLFANLMEISAEDLRALKLRDFKRVQDAYVSFTD